MRLSNTNQWQDFNFIHLSCKLGYAIAYNEFGSTFDAQMEVVWTLETYKYDEGRRRFNI